MGAILRNGFETGGGISSGVRKISSASTEGVTQGPINGLSARKDLNNNGGSYFFYRNNTLTGGSMKFERPVKEGFLRMPYALASYPFATGSIMGITSGNIRQFGLAIASASNRSINISNIFTAVDTTPGGIGVWITTYIRFLIDDTGYIDYYENGDFSSKLMSYSGDTSTVNVGNVDGFEMSTVNGTTTLFDDLAVNDITMTYSSGSGPLPAVGGSILGQNSGARAIITSVLPGSTSSSGTLQLCLVRNSSMQAWSGIILDDPFLSETIDDSLSSNLWSASITGLDKNSGFPTDAYIIGLTVSQDVAGKIQLSRTSGSNNFEMLNQIPNDDTSYVFSDTLNNRDVYELESFPLAPSEVGSIVSVTANINSAKSGSSINNISVILEHNSVEYESEDKPLTNSFASVTKIYDVLPNGDSLTVPNINNLRLGIKFKG